MKVLIFGREPAVITAAITAFVALLSAFMFHFSPETQSLINAFATAGMATVVAVMVRDGNLITVVMGAAKAGLALALGFGLQWDAVQQATAMTVLEVFLSLILRAQVVAPVNADNTTRTSAEVKSILVGMKRNTPILVAGSALMFMTSCALFPNFESTLPSIRAGAKVATIFALSKQANPSAAAAKIIPLANDIATLAKGDAAPTVEALQAQLEKYLNTPYSSFITAPIATLVINGYKVYYDKVGGDSKKALVGLGYISEGVAEGAAYFSSAVPTPLLSQFSNPRRAAVYSGAR